MEPKIDEMRINPEIEKEALRRFREKLAEWDVAMPGVEPLVMDFGLGDALVLEISKPCILLQRRENRGLASRNRKLIELRFFTQRQRR